MPKNKDLKRLIKARQAKTGEPYTTARAHIVEWEQSQSHDSDFWLKDDVWLDRARKEGAAGEDFVVVELFKGVGLPRTIFVINRNEEESQPSITITYYQVNRNNEVEREQPMRFEGKWAFAVRDAANRYLVHQGEGVGVSKAPFDLVDSRSFEEIEQAIGPDAHIAFVHPEGADYALTFGHGGRTLPAPNPCAGIGIMWREESDRIFTSSISIIGVSAHTLRSAVNKFVVGPG